MEGGKRWEGRESVYILGPGLVALSDIHLRKEQSSRPLGKTSISTRYEDCPAPPQKRKTTSSNPGRLLGETQRSNGGHLPPARHQFLERGLQQCCTMFQCSVSASEPKKQEQTTTRKGCASRSSIRPAIRIYIKSRESIETKVDTFCYKNMIKAEK